MKLSDVEVNSISSLQGVDAKIWNSLNEENFPFVSYEFLSCLEDSNSVGEKKGWAPKYILARQDSELIGVLIFFKKTDSYGEYIFDWAWANAYHQYGCHYYPKMTSAVPFTPATGSKFLTRLKGEAKRTLFEVLIEYVEKSWGRNEVSSHHHLFLPRGELNFFSEKDYMIRKSFQYHWKNRSYRDFDDFLSSLKGKKAKNIRKERRESLRLGEGVEIEIQKITDEELSEKHAEVFYGFYLSTISKKGAIPYLTKEFFILLFRRFSENVLLCLARVKNTEEVIAGSLCLFNKKRIYGRYWGAKEEAKFLHFEMCYYTPIEFAIENEIEVFEAGAQGEHKIQRGFLPEITFSAHKILAPEFSKAIDDFIEEESNDVQKIVGHLSSFSPFKT